MWSDGFEMVGQAAKAGPKKGMRILSPQPPKLRSAVTQAATFDMVSPMRLLLALLAVLAMLASPAIAAARANCSGAMQSVSSTMGAPDAAPMDMTAKTDHAAMPCCPNAKQKPDQSQKQDGKGCAQACAAMSGMAIAIAPIGFAKTLLAARVVLTASNRASARSFEPRGLERPPKHIA